MLCCFMRPPHTPSMIFPTCRLVTVTAWHFLCRSKTSKQFNKFPPSHRAFPFFFFVRVTRLGLRVNVTRNRLCYAYATVIRPFAATKHNFSSHFVSGHIHSHLRISLAWCYRTFLILPHHPSPIMVLFFLIFKEDEGFTGRRKIIWTAALCVVCWMRSYSPMWHLTGSVKLPNKLWYYNIYADASS